MNAHKEKMARKRAARVGTVAGFEYVPNRRHKAFVEAAVAKLLKSEENPDGKYDDKATAYQAAWNQLASLLPKPAIGQRIRYAPRVTKNNNPAYRK